MKRIKTTFILSEDMVKSMRNPEHSSTLNTYFHVLEKISNAEFITKNSNRIWEFSNIFLT